MISSSRIYFYQTYSGTWNYTAVSLDSNVKNTDGITIQNTLHTLVQVISSFVQHPHDQFRQHKHL